MNRSLRHLNVLFIGNSHTYLHKMPWMIADLASADHRGSSLYVAQCTGNGVNLKWHWHDRATREAIAAGPWDYVVLQDRSGGPLEQRDLFERHADLLDGEIKKQGAATLFYMTWARRSRPGDPSDLAEAYADTARRLGAGLVPVGLAWQKAICEAPDIDLYHPDGRHAGPAGAYLAACVFYTVLFKSTPEGLPSAITVNGKQRVKLDSDRALKLQRIAFRTVRGLDPQPDRHVTPFPDRPVSESRLESIRQHIECMRLESVTAVLESNPSLELGPDLDAVAHAFREQAHDDRSRGALHAALCLERRAWALEVFKTHGLDPSRLIRTVDFAVGYNGKILMVGITGERIPGRVCLRSGDDWHHEILINTEAEMRDLGFETALVTPVGGAWVQCGTSGPIVVYGTSEAYGACDKENAARLITRVFPGRTVSVRD